MKTTKFLFFDSVKVSSPLETQPLNWPSERFLVTIEAHVRNGGRSVPIIHCVYASGLGPTPEKAEAKAFKNLRKEAKKLYKEAKASARLFNIIQKNLKK